MATDYGDSFWRKDGLWWATGHGTWMDAFMEDHYGPVLGESKTVLGNFSFLLVCAFVFSVCLYSPHLFWPMEASSPASLM